MDRADPPPVVAGEWGAFKLAEDVAADDSRIFSRRASHLGLFSGDCEASVPMFEVRKIGEAIGSIAEIPQFARAGAKLKILRNCDAGSRSVASGLRCSGFFCGATGRPHFLPPATGVLTRSSFFDTGRLL